MFVDWFKNVSANFVYLYEIYTTNCLVTVINCVFTFHTTIFFGCLHGIMTQFELIKHK